ncbi:MAG: protein-(glutamine-N5) methyltransferase, release factor-specific [Candidatus Lumbricidophila eiseniae]|uniref:Release factor glutamine methyltransferase n=1 Tax=Candidatus Lumbricidiphila eiseniae TaxID=1969409 RepID=A0A2A6FTA1_9MICO|nr:MAG: protein-(glutamine-N5) methyltransferase, release factor-specific [Candidatus Lumbricidophila eiseniae]
MNVSSGPGPVSGAGGLRALRDLMVARFVSAGVPTPVVDAELLLCYVLGLTRGQLQVQIALGDRRVDAPERTALAALVQRRCRREPLQHLTGRAPFRALELAVGPGVFIPRPETELVAQLAIDDLRAARVAAAATGLDPFAVTEPGALTRLRAVDLCSGSGAIALAMATEVPGVRVWAVEKSPEAYAWLTRNVAESGVTTLIPVLSDLGTAVPELDGTVAVVASNPPYVPIGMVPREPEVQLFDPELALYGGDDGLDVVRALSLRAGALLRPGGTLIIEHGEYQSASVAALLSADGWGEISHHHDLTGRERVTRTVKLSVA